MKKLLLIIALSGVSAFSAAAEVWQWGVHVGRIKTFGGSTNIACFEIKENNKNICFDVSEGLGKEKYATILSAKLSDSALDLSYLDDQSMNVWFSNFKAHHIWLK